MSEKKTVLLSEVKKHNTDEDCWVIFSGKAYSLSDYLFEHPGGLDIIVTHAGQDGTTAFENNGHTPEARETLKQYYVGDVIDDSPSDQKEQFKSSWLGFPLYAFILIIGLCIIYYQTNILNNVVQDKDAQFDN